VYTRFIYLMHFINVLVLLFKCVQGVHGEDTAVKVLY